MWVEKIECAKERGDKKGLLEKLLTKVVWVIGELIIEAAWCLETSLQFWEVRKESSCLHWVCEMGHWGALYCGCDIENCDWVYGFCEPWNCGEYCIILVELARLGWLRNKVSKFTKAGIGRRAISKRSIAGNLISWELSFWLITKWVAMKFIAFISYIAYKTTVCANRSLLLCIPPFSSLINMISPLIILISTTLIVLMALISLRIGMSHIQSYWFNNHLSNLTYLSTLFLL